VREDVRKTPVFCGHVGEEVRAIRKEKKEGNQAKLVRENERAEEQ